MEDHAPMPPSLTQFINRLDHTENLTIAGIAAWMRGLEWDDAWLESCQREPLPDDDYARHILTCTPRYELAVITWPPGRGSEIHDHGVAGTYGAVLVMKGQMFNYLYTIQDGQPEKGDESQVHVGQVIDVPQHLVHQMGNASEKEVAMSLHLYTPPIEAHQCWSHAPASQTVGG